MESLSRKKVTIIIGSALVVVLGYFLLIPFVFGLIVKQVFASPPSSIPTWFHWLQHITYPAVKLGEIFPAYESYAEYWARRISGL